MQGWMAFKHCSTLLLLVELKQLTGHAHQLPKFSTYFDSTGGSVELLRKNDTLCLSHSPSSLLDGK
eukprot:3565795-Ditylum_brightwellii.AAC.1